MRIWEKFRRPATEPSPSQADTPDAGRARIQRLQVLARRGLWGMCVFLLVSLAVFSLDSLVPQIPLTVREKLGASPPTNLISLALVVYSFSALILTLSRISSGNGKYKGWSHIGYLSGFYAFYFYAEALHTNFWAVFAAGITILALEYYQIWGFCMENIRLEEENLQKAERMKKFNA
jgi:hypothetical protein